MQVNLSEMNIDDRQGLIELAKDSIRTFFENEEPDINNTLRIAEKSGVYVTIYIDNKKYGEKGIYKPLYPIYKAVIEAARSAAFGDSRSPVLTKEDLEKIKIKISILTEPELIEVSDPEEYANKIKIGQDGLVLEGDKGYGLLLPEFAEQNNYTTTQFLNALSQSAGLSFSGWQDLNNRIYRFQTEIIEE